MGVSPGLAPSHNACPSPRLRGQTSGDEAPRIMAGVTPRTVAPSPLGPLEDPHPHPHPDTHPIPHTPNSGTLVPLPTSHLELHPLPSSPAQPSFGSRTPRPEVEGTPGWLVQAPALLSGQGCSGSPGPDFLLTSKYSRSVSFSSGEVLRIWNQGEQDGRGSAKAKRYWEDPGEEGARRPTVGPGPGRHLPRGLCVCRAWAGSKGPGTGRQAPGMVLLPLSSSWVPLTSLLNFRTGGIPPLHG